MKLIIFIQVPATIICQWVRKSSP